MSARVRRLGAADASLLRNLRLRALADAPMAFGSTLAREEAFAAQEWERRAVASGARARPAPFNVGPAPRGAPRGRDPDHTHRGAR